MIGWQQELDAPVIVYSSYEQTRLRELAEAFPELRASLERDRLTLNHRNSHAVILRCPAKQGLEG